MGKKKICFKIWPLSSSAELQMCKIYLQLVSMETIDEIKVFEKNNEDIFIISAHFSANFVPVMTFDTGFCGCDT